MRNKRSIKQIVTVSIAILVGVSAIFISSPVTHADKYDDKINALEVEMQEYEEQASKLAKEARSLENELARLDIEKKKIQKKIDLTQATYEKLKKQIKETEIKIQENRKALGVILADLYVDDTISPLEMLASSNNIGDYVDKQTYRTSVSDQLKATISEIKDLKKALEKQKTLAERALEDQKNAKNQLISKENERQGVLAKTRGKESEYKKLLSARKKEIDKQRKLQQEEIARRLAAASSGGGMGYTVVPGAGVNGGYPDIWAYAPQDSMVDNWGMYNRECTSYAAFRVDQAYGNMPYWGGIGNAYQWIGNAISIGIPNGKTPKAGSIGVLSDGGYGHVGWIHSVESDGTITIDHYNINWSGQYQRWTGVSPSFFDDYIYFGEW